MNNSDTSPTGPPPLNLHGIPLTSVQPPPMPIPDTLGPLIEGPAKRDFPPDGRFSQTLLVPTTGPIKIAPYRISRQGVLIRNEDGTNSIRFSESSSQVSFTPTLQGTLLKANESIILRGSLEVWALATGGACQVSVCDEYYALPHQHQPFGM